MCDGDNKNILNPGEIDFYINFLEPTKVEDIASLGWFEFHHRLQKLNQQSSVEAKEYVEEKVKERFVSSGKLYILINEAISIEIWRDKVFKHLLKVDGQPSNTFIAYIILYHELTAVGLLQNILYHKDAMEALDDLTLDLVDYCACEVVNLLVIEPTSELKSPQEFTNLEEIAEQAKVIGFNVSLTCMCIVGYMVQYIDILPLSTVKRLYTTHDMPLLICNLIQRQPWKRINKKTNKPQLYEDGTWKNIDKVEGVCKYEGQCWIALRTLLVNPLSISHYEITEIRKQHLVKMQKYLHETIIDQISPLIELKQWLVQLTMSQPPTNSRQSLIMETIPQIKTNILTQGMNKWKKIAKKHIGIIFDQNKELSLQIAKRLGETYDIEDLEKLSLEEPTCSNCGDLGVKKCSKCKSEWYCGRECQVKRWPKHKPACNLLVGDGDK